MTKGDIILTYADSQIDIQLMNLKDKLQLLNLKKDRDHEVFNFKRQQIIQQISLDQEIGKRLQQLFLFGAVEETKILSNKTAVIKSQISLASLESEHSRLNSINDIDINATLTQIRQLEDKKQFFNVKAPVDGVIQDFKYQTVGERLVAGDVIATIIPRVNLIARVNVPSTISAPVELGKKASIDVDAYPSSDFGSINGELVSLSPKTITSQAK